MTGHWGRFLAQIAILVTMAVVYAISPDVYLIALSVSLLALPVANWTVFGILAWSSRQAPEIDSLADRVDDQLTLSLASTVAAVIGGLVLGRVLGFIAVPNGSVLTVGLGFIVVVISIPALRFLKTWRDVWLPMIRIRRDRDLVSTVETSHEDRMNAMEDRLTGLIDENTRVSQQASNHADAAYHEANTINEKLAVQADALIQQGADRADREAGR